MSFLCYCYKTSVFDRKKKQKKLLKQILNGNLLSNIKYKEIIDLTPQTQYLFTTRLFVCFN